MQKRRKAMNQPDQLEDLAWIKYAKARYLYYVCSPKETSMVLTEGITALRPRATGGPNAIPLFVGREHAADIARSMGLPDFALFRITKKAIPKCLLKWDNSARAHAMVSFYLESDTISASAISGYEGPGLRIRMG
jgi:hypothetical protein